MNLDPSHPPALGCHCGAWTTSCRRRGFHGPERRSDPALRRPQQGKRARRRLLQRRIGRLPPSACASRCFTASTTPARQPCSKSRRPSTAAIFPLAGSDKVVDMRRVNDSERQSEDGVWQFTCDFQCTVYLSSRRLNNNNWPLENGSMAG